MSGLLVLRNCCAHWNVAGNEAPSALNTAQMKPDHHLIQQPRERLPVPQDWLLTPQIYIENYNSFSLLSCRNLYPCISGSSRLLFRNIRASAQIPEKFSLPQQLQFKLCTQPGSQLSTQDWFPGLSTLLEELGKQQVLHKLGTTSTALPLLLERSSCLP